MPSLDSLPADQRAVLDLVLQRGRSYDEIARMLGIDRAGVRKRAQEAFDALGPQTRVEPLRRALITDYLLGQLPERVGNETRDSLARSPTERAWARVLASELAPLARDPLPEIPTQEPAATTRETEPVDAGARTKAGTGAGATKASAKPGEEADDGADGARSATARRPRRSSRLGGALILGTALVAAIVVVVLLATGGGSKRHTNPAHRTTPSTATSTTSTRVIAQVNLLPPGGGGTAKGIAQVITTGSSTGVAIFATGVPPNNHNAYAVWLYNSPASSKLVGFVSPGVTSNGQLQTEGPLPTDASRYKQLLVTLETQQHPRAPGPVVLQGTLTLP